MGKKWVLRIFPSQFRAILAAALRCLNLKQLFVEDIRWKKDTNADKSGFKKINKEISYFIVNLSWWV